MRHNNKRVITSSLVGDGGDRDAKRQRNVSAANAAIIPPPPPNTPVPEWLLRSEHAKTQMDNGDDGVVSGGLPVCPIDCADGRMYYTVLGAWCMSWEDTPKPQFIPAWFNLSASVRRNLVCTKKVFAEELDPSTWLRRMIDRDDAAMFAALPDSTWEAATTDKKFDVAIECIQQGATGCIQVLAQRNQWPADEWTDRIFFRGRSRHTQWKHASACNRAASLGWTTMLRLLHEHGCPWTVETTANAAGGGHFVCLMYLRTHGCPWDASACTRAASNSQLECLVYLHENGCPWTKHTFVAAAMHSDMSVVRYLCEHHCPWDASVAAASVAASSAALERLTYLHEQGCPWDETTCVHAVFGVKLNCLQYARTHGCPWDRTQCLHALGVSGDHAMTQWFAANSNE